MLRGKRAVESGKAGVFGKTRESKRKDAFSEKDSVKFRTKKLFLRTHEIFQIYKFDIGT